VDAPVDAAEMRRQRADAVTIPGYKPIFNRANGYGYDPAEQRTLTFTGLGSDINVHDQWAVEGQGRIQDRTREHLGRTDKGITTYRRMLSEAIAQVERGETPKMVLSEEAAARLRGPAALDGIGPTQDWERYWAETSERRRAASPWAEPVAG
jgi:hypothetical protein